VSFLYPYLLVTHLFSAIIFIGALFMWTFVIDKAYRGKYRKILGKECIDRSEEALSKHTRRILKVAVAVLLLSGFGMFHIYAKPLFAFDSLFSFMFGLKVLLGMVVGALFYAMPYIHARLPIHKRDRLHDKLHMFMFLCVVLIVLNAKFMMYA